MKLPVLLIISTIVFATIASALFNKNNDVPGIFVQQVFATKIVKNNSITCGNDTGPICADDCRTLLACVGDDEPEYTESCERNNYQTRYCVGNVCAKLPDGTNPQCNVDTFRCTSAGVFPDPYDCSQYYSCGTDLTPSKFKCPTDYVYASESKLCRKNSEYYCQNFDFYCSWNNNKFIPFWSNRAYYAFCGVPIVMFKCVDEKNYVFDTKTNDCVYNCKRSGYFVNPADCSQYFICEYTGNGLNSVLQSCPIGMKFNGLQCIESDVCPEIIESTTTPWPSTTTPWPWTTDTTRRTTWPDSTTTRRTTWPWTSTTRRPTWPGTTTTRRSTWPETTGTWTTGTWTTGTWPTTLEPTITTETEK